jgi:hypothetical protein
LLPSDNLLLNAPQIVNKRQRRLKGIDEIVLSLTAKGLTTEERCPLPGCLRARAAAVNLRDAARLSALR